MSEQGKRAAGVNSSIITATGLRDGELTTLTYCSYGCWALGAPSGYARRDYVNCYEFEEKCSNCGTLIPGSKEREMSDTGLYEWLDGGETGVLAKVHGPLRDFYRWGTNYEPGSNPFGLFLDIIGWSVECLGGNLYDYDRFPVGYMEADYLADALHLWADRPSDVEKWLEKLEEMEAGDDE